MRIAAGLMRFRNAADGDIVAAPSSANGRSMPAPNPSKTIPKKKVRIHSEKYLIRTIEPDDASDRWANWMSDPEATHMLNMAARSWKKADVVDYIKTFDQRSHLLLGIFEKQSGTHIGIFTVDINYGLGHFLVNLLIGEPAYRNKHVTTSIAVPFREYFFETLGLNAAMASVLSRNAAMIHYLLKNGWQLDQTLKQGAKSNADGAMLDVSLFSLSREAWREWKKKNLAQSDKN
jgi:RimJ/RimL family protein N-acetyltransferase